MGLVASQESPERLLPLFALHIVRLQGQVSSLQPEGGFSPEPDHACTLILDLEPPEV